MDDRKFDLPDGEDIVLNPAPERYWHVNRIRVGPKVCTFFQGKKGDEYVSFQKKRFGGQELLEVTLRQLNTRREVEVCNLGHEHEKEHWTPVLWNSFCLPWEHVEQFIGWLEKGNWTQVQKRKLEGLD